MNRKQGFTAALFVSLLVGVSGCGSAENKTVDPSAPSNTSEPVREIKKCMEAAGIVVEYDYFGGLKWSNTSVEAADFADKVYAECDEEIGWSKQLERESHGG